MWWLWMLAACTPGISEEGVVEPSVAPPYWGSPTEPVPDDTGPAGDDQEHTRDHDDHQRPEDVDIDWAPGADTAVPS
jgi:hypothetical protein